jgi:hypothetical protein
MGSIIEKNQRSTISCYCTFKEKVKNILYRPYMYTGFVLIQFKKSTAGDLTSTQWAAVTMTTGLQLRRAAPQPRHLLSDLGNNKTA